jgi:hypothetical protein
MLVKGLLEQPAEISDINCIDDVSKTDNLFINFDIIKITANCYVEVLRQFL